MSPLPDDFHFLLTRLFLPQPYRAVKTDFKIIRSLLPQKASRHRYMHQDGKLDYLGQLLVQLGHNVEGKHRFPSDLGKVITPFTQPSRGSIIDSITTLQILELDFTPQDLHEARLRAILPNWNLHFVP